jgi:hypothetical protein
MLVSSEGSVCFWHVGGPRLLNFGHLHGTHVDLPLIARMSSLRSALMAEPPELRIAVIVRGKVKRLLDRAEVASILGRYELR